jgi:hemoglobin
MLEALHMDSVDFLYTQLGEPILRDLVAAFYRRVRSDDILGPMYPPNDWAGAEKRLADFLIYRFGGPPTYIQERGHPRLRARHLPFAISARERDRWLDLMSAATEECRIPEREKMVLTAFFTDVADAMRNRPD